MARKSHLLPSLTAPPQKSFKPVHVPYEMRCIKFILHDLHNSLDQQLSKLMKVTSDSEAFLSIWKYCSQGIFFFNTEGK